MHVSLRRCDTIWDMTWTTTLKAAPHKNRAWVPPRPDTALEKWDPGGPRWDPDGTRWDPVGPGWDPASKTWDPVNPVGLVWEKWRRWEPDGTRLAKQRDPGTYVGKMEPGDDLDLAHFSICACHSCRRGHTNFLCVGLYRSFQVYRMVRWGKNHMDQLKDLRWQQPAK